MTMRSLIRFACLAGGLLAASPAFAANKNQTKERQAKKACLSGDYVKGVGILADLFIESNDPTFLFNQGRCYENGVRFVEAAERFREYLRKATNLSAEDKADVDNDVKLINAHVLMPEEVREKRGIAPVEEEQTSEKKGIAPEYLTRAIFEAGVITHDELRARLLGLIAAPATKLAQLANAPAAKVARVVAAYAAKDAA